MAEADKAVAEPEAKNEKRQPDPTHAISFWRRRGVIVAGTALLAGLLVVGSPMLLEGFTHETTDDAFLDAHIVSIAPKVAGQIASVAVADNQSVRPGDLLAEIDPRDLQVQLDQKRAAVKSAEVNAELLQATVELYRSQITTAEATAKQSAAEVAASQAKAERTAADLKRAKELVANQTVSAQEFDTAKADATAAEADLQAAREQAESDRSKVAQAQAQLEAGLKAWERAKAQVREAEPDARAAELSLSYARITAPEAGRVTRKAVEPGNYVQVGQNLMALVPTELYVTANFKESQLARLRTNQLARISIDAVTGRTFAGHVDSVQAGSGARFSLLPPENAVGNYVKVVQRVPVKLVFDEPLPPDQVLGPGMSVVPSVHVSSLEISRPVMSVVAVLVALLVGTAWWMATARRDKPAIP